MASLRTLFLTLCLALPVLLMAEPALRPVKVVLFPVREAEIVSRIDGTVRNCILKMGDAFKKGDLIMQIDDSRLRIELARAKAREQDVRIQAQFAKETYLSYKKLFEEQIRSHNELARRKAEADSLQARMLISAADVSEAQLMLGYCVFKAPFAGRLEQMLCREHETVRAGQPVFRIIDDSSLLAVMNVPQELPLRKGSVIKMAFRDGKVSVSGKVYEISPRADHRSGTVEVKALVENSKKHLSAGMVGFMISGER
jgi:RND family efflux transporter MFP subunit